MFVCVSGTGVLTRFSLPSVPLAELCVVDSSFTITETKQTLTAPPPCFFPQPEVNVTFGPVDENGLLNMTFNSSVPIAGKKEGIRQSSFCS